MTIGIGLLGLGTVGAGVAAILASPEGRHPLLAELALRRVAVRDLARPRPVALASDLLTTDPRAVIEDPAVEIVVEVMGGLETDRTPLPAAIRFCLISKLNTAQRLFTKTPVKVSSIRSCKASMLVFLLTGQQVVVKHTLWQGL